MTEIKPRDLYKMYKCIRKVESILYKYGTENHSIWIIWEALQKPKYFIKQRIYDLEKEYYG